MKRIIISIICLGLVLSMSTTAQSKKVGKQDWKKHRSRHFIIYYKDAPKDFVKNVEEAAEKYYKEITSNLGFNRYEGWSFDNRASIYIYSDQQDYVNNARQAGWSHGAANARKKTIYTFPAAHGFFDSTLPHELGHIIFREFIGHYVLIPSWMDEGVAMYQERAKRWGAHKTVKEAMSNGKFIPLTELSRVRLSANTNQSVVNLFYAEAASVVYYMISELGERRFVNFCKALRDGNNFNQAMSEAYARFDNIEELNKSWEIYLKKQ